ncbi:MAG TPA: OmpH family outer membrane protein [Hyphomonadaceae bacterium]|nr:OmpH family outer membrane protein [Hyphomonadaceae bacterium]
MKLRSLALAAVLAVGVADMAGAAFAQTKVYVVNEERVRRESKVGKEMTAKLGDVRNQGVDKLGLKSLGDEIKAEQDSLKPQTQSLTKEALDANPTLKARVEALNKKEVEFQQKADYLNSGLEQSSGNLNMAFAQVLGPAVDNVAKAAGADVVVSYASTWYVKDAIDITPKVIARLDATVPTLAALQAAIQPPAGAKPAPGAAPAPATPAPAAPAKPQ